MMYAQQGHVMRMRYANTEVVLALALIALLFVSGVAIMAEALLWLLRH